MTIRVACIGAGYFSQFHLGSWQRIMGANCVGVCDRDMARATATGAPGFDDLTKMLRAVTPDLLDIILPPQAQPAAIRTALAEGIPWIICQKPFCTSLEEARTIVAEAEAQGATLIVHENFRFQPWYRRIGQAMDDGLIGDVLQATFRLRPGDGQGPDAYLDRQPYFQTMERFLVHETAVHWADTFRYLLGNPVAVYADLRQINPAIRGEDAGVILFDHPGGARSMFDGNRLLDHAARNHRCTMGEGLFEGTTGTLTLLGDGSVHHRAIGALTSHELLGPDRSETFGGDCVHRLQTHVIEAMGDGQMPENTGRAYLEVLEIEAAIYASAASGQKQTVEGAR